MPLVAFVEYDVHDTGGSLHTMRDLMALFKGVGWQVSVINCAASSPPTYPKLPDIPVVSMYSADKVLNRANLIVSPHYPCWKTVRRINREFRLPVIYVVNFASEMSFLGDGVPGETALFVNSAMKGALTLPSRVYFPVVNPALWQTGTDPASAPYDVGLVNCNVMKGGHLFGYLAHRLTGYKFLAVRRYYGTSVNIDLPNVTLIDHGPSLRDGFFGKIKVLVVPSQSESWGRVAVEAMSSGIPVLYSRPVFSETDPCTTKGLEECVGDTTMGFYPTDIGGWADALKRLLDDPVAYAAASAKARARAQDLYRNCDHAAVVSWMTSQAGTKRTINAAAVGPAVRQSILPNRGPATVSAVAVPRAPVKLPGFMTRA